MSNDKDKTTELATISSIENRVAGGIACVAILFIQPYKSFLAVKNGSRSWENVGWLTLLPFLCLCGIVAICTALVTAFTIGFFIPKNEIKEKENKKLEKMN